MTEPKPSSKPPASYREASEEIEEILARLEGDAEGDIDELADRVERASELIRFCFDRLKSAEVRVKKITQELEETTGESPDEESA